MSEIIAALVNEYVTRSRLADNHLVPHVREREGHFAAGIAHALIRACEVAFDMNEQDATEHAHELILACQERRYGG